MVVAHEQALVHRLQHNGEPLLVSQLAQRADGGAERADSVLNGLLMAVAHEVPALAQGLGLTVWQSGLGLFFIGWVLQFIGHYLEGRKPAFVDDLVGLLVGPMFVVGEVLMWAGLLKRMHMDIERQAGATR